MKPKLAKWKDPKVQKVYALLCDGDEASPKIEEHWEGWIARRIVAELEAMGDEAEIARLRDRLDLIGTSPYANGWAKDRAKAALLPPQKADDAGREP